MKTTFFLFCSVLIVLILTSCGGQPAPKSPGQVTPPPQTSAEHIQQLLDEAQTSDSPLREEKWLQAAGLLLQEGQADLAEQLINSVNAHTLSVHLYAVYTQVIARLSMQRGDYVQALRYLEAPRLLNTMDQLALRMQFTLNLLRAEVFALSGSHLASAQQRIYIDPLLDPSEQQANREGIWQSLMYVSVDELQRYLKTSVGEQYRGWLELALIGKDSQGDLDEQLRQLENWQQHWPGHPASQHLPGGLALIKELAQNRPQQVALLLPLSGRLAPFGKAIRDGFIAAMYQTRLKGGQIPRLTFYDTQRHDDFMALYHQAINDGAQMVIGPLEKQRVRLLFDEVTLPVPTLALNRIDDYGQPAQQLFQFGLAPQDEARQIAAIAYLDNHRKAMIVAPQGEWGSKVVDAFQQRWQQLGAQIIATSIYSGQKDYSSTIKESLLLADSEKRARRISRLVRQHTEFSPRRRRDIDMVFLLARPAQARSIKPLFAYHYAGQLPVYGTSHIYTGMNAPDKDADINGIRFIDMPWVLNPPSELRRQINLEMPRSKHYQHMFALGVDSFQLHPRLRQLKEIPSSRVYGQTGTLKLNDKKEIEREMLFAQIQRGQARLMPTAGQPISLTHTTMEGISNDKTRKKQRSFNRQRH